ncbi:DUF1990 family protein [Geodermatophilus sp. DSM 44513]|uniref:DUF1990 family protein n=1 Tax=Geodermatophilus sp. DSM 44513 TaxID=1528104 RepID=UPI00128A5B15|nr:DUF1990 domain-containing protein [Geodermatophilus sp. DSM 44513]WNV75645.1 DUF1990 domain-containing protein [Geodermatophilus sp. DSM 44513]
MTSYSAVGATCAAEETWSRRPAGFRALERSVRIGRGDECWRLATVAVVHWGVKTRSGFDVRPVSGTDLRVGEGQDFTLVARIGPLRVREPVRVVAVVERPDRCGFAYGTLPGHPVTGEEAFVVHRDADGSVWLTLRSLTRPGRGLWRLVFPAALVAQRWYRRRYARALLGDGGGPGRPAVGD